MGQVYFVITYRLNRKTKPCDVVEVLETLIQEHSLYYLECLFRVNVSIVEDEFDGKLHTNRKRNAINTLLRRHPELEAFYQYTCRGDSSTYIYENASISNFFLDDFSCSGEIDHNLICDTVKQVPRPYGVDDLELIYNGVSFGEKNAESGKIRQPKSGFDMPVGNYIWYSRSNYGAEKHSYIYFATNDENLLLMRKLFFAFAEAIPGRYEGTECHD